MRLRLAVGWFLAIVCAMPAHVSASHFGPYPAPDTQVWPGSGTATPDLPFSSTFGPRQKSSEQSRYDWHRGADIPLPCTGRIRGSGLHLADVRRCTHGACRMISIDYVMPRRDREQPSGDLTPLRRLMTPLRCLDGLLRLLGRIEHEARAVQVT